jgi:hypothetical protein
MNTTGPSHPFLNQALAEHRHLHEQVCEILHLLEAEATSAEQFDLIIARVRAVEEWLQEHFAREEEGGCLEEAISRAPAFAAQAAALHREHAQFVLMIDRVARHAQEARDWRKRWSELRADFQKFAQKLHAHEQAENELLGRAFNVAVV